MKPLNRICLLALIMAGICVPGAQCRLPDDLRPGEMVFIYVHGLGETRSVVAFEENMRRFLEGHSIPARVFTFRWDQLKIDLTTIAHQWTEAKDKTDQAAPDFLRDLEKLEKMGVDYEIVGFSLGTRVVARALERGKATLNHLRGVTFMGAALPHDFTFKSRCLPAGMVINNYYSGAFDDVLKVAFYNAEGVDAGGEVGFDDTAHFRNLRTVCTHIHKGGPIQRDYSCLAPAIASLALLRQKIFLRGEPVSYNIESSVMGGEVNWNDIAEFPASSGRVLIQQNVNTQHYRAVAIAPGGKRTRKAWGSSLHSILQNIDLFPGPYRQVIDGRKEKYK